MTVLPYLTPLSADDLRAANIPAPWAFGMRDRVRFGELDVVNHVNNAVYLKWFEGFRVSYFAHHGIVTGMDQDTHFVLRNVGLDFLSEVTFGQSYILTGRTVSFRTTSFAMEYGVWVDGRQTTQGSALLVLLDNAGRKAPLPQAWKAGFVYKDGAAAG